MSAHPDWHLAQFNVAVPRFPLDSEGMRPFMENLDAINGLGDRSPGFVWRHADASGSSTETRIDGHPDELLNLTVWEDVESLWNYVYKSDHTDFLRRRREWFEPPGDTAVAVLWWVPAGTRPTPEEAFERLEQLRERGEATPEAFTFRHRFDPPS